MTKHTVTVNELLDGHVMLDIECPDRIYLNAYVPVLQSSGQVVAFFTQHLGYPIPSPAVFDKIGSRFRKAVEKFASGNGIAWIRFGTDDRKIDVMQPYLDRQAAAGRPGVAAIGVAQEFARVWTAYQRETAGPAPQFTFAKADRRVTCYYFYLHDEDFGPAFIKVCSYFPCPAKVWVNGHERAKRQAARSGIGFTVLSNGFGSCEDPAGLQAICDRLQPGTIEVFAQRWLHVLPMPLGPADQGHGYWRELSMRQVEISRTIVFDAPCRVRAFFEALIADNLDIGRPANVEIIFGRRIQRNTQGTFRTAIGRPAAGPDNQGVILNVFYKHSRVKQYLKDGRAMRIETVINAPRDLGCNARLPNLDELQAKARAVNRRIVEAGRAGQATVLASPAFERIAHPSVTADGRRTPALRSGDPRVMTLAGALASTLLAASGITNKSLRALMTGLRQTPYTPGQMTYDLRRLRLAAAVGARPLGVASQRNRDYLRGLGASEVFDYHADDWVQQVRDAVPGGVDVLFDAAGGQTRDQAVGAVREGGRAIFLAGAPAQLGRGVVGESLDADVNRQRLEALGRLVEAGRLRPQVEAVLPFRAGPRGAGAGRGPAHARQDRAPDWIRARPAGITKLLIRGFDTVC